MRFTISTLLISLFLVVFTSGCILEADDDDVVGPIGNADIFSVNFTFDLFDTQQAGTVASAQFDVPGITPSVVDEGTVLVYYRFAGTWTALPYTFGVEGVDEDGVPFVDYNATFGYGYDDEFIDVFVEATTDDEVVWDEIRDFEVFRGGTPMKAVIIDALPIAAKQGTLDLRDYEAVKEYYGLEE